MRLWYNKLRIGRNSVQVQTSRFLRAFLENIYFVFLLFIKRSLSATYNYILKLISHHCKKKRFPLSRCPHALLPCIKVTLSPNSITHFVDCVFIRTQQNIHILITKIAIFLKIIKKNLNVHFNDPSEN